MRRVVLAALSTVAGLILLLSFKTHSTTAAITPSAPGTGTSTSEPDTTSGSAGTSAGPTTTLGGATKTVTGPAVGTRYGPVEVQITVGNGQVTAVTAVEYPQESSRDAQINAYAIPQLNQEAVAAQSSKIDMISGATYTSSGYITSLQGALTKAGLA